MIGFVRDLLVEFVLTPQATVDVEERRAFLDVERRPIDVMPQDLELLATRTVPIGFEIGDAASVELRHTIDVGVDVQHGDAAEAERIRDLIVRDLCVRCLGAAGAFMAADDPTTGQSVSRVTFEVDWRPVYVNADSPNSTATITFTIDADLDGSVALDAP